MWAVYLSRYSDWLRAGWSGDRIPVGRDFPPVQTGPGDHPASCTMGIESFPRVKYGRGVLLTPHPLLVPCSWKSKAIYTSTHPLGHNQACNGNTTLLYLLVVLKTCTVKQFEMKFIINRPWTKMVNGTTVESVQWHWQLVAGLLLRSSAFKPKPTHILIYGAE